MIKALNGDQLNDFEHNGSLVLHMFVNYIGVYAETQVYHIYFNITLISFSECNPAQ